jgi:4-carboxymuconolactone decarboxylase
MTPDGVRARYRELLGFVPDNLEKRLALARTAGRMASVEAVEAFREELIHHNPLDRKTQQLVHLAMLLAMGQTAPARLHVRGAIKAGATPSDLYGVCLTGAVVGGMPLFSQAVDLVHEILKDDGLLNESLPETGDESPPSPRGPSPV